MRKTTSTRLATLTGLMVVALFAFLNNAPYPRVSALTDRLEWLAYDLRLRYTLPVQAEYDPRVVIVDIDEQSLAREGHWPWPRARLAQLLENLLAANPAVVALDVVFAEAERNPVDVLLAAPPVVGDLQQVLAGLRPDFDGDARLATAIQGQPVVLGYVLTNTAAAPVGRLPPPSLELAPQALRALPMRVLRTYTANLPALQDAAMGAGFFGVDPDDDGVIRRAPLLLRHGYALYGSLGLEAARAYFGGLPLELRTVEVGGETVLEGVSLGGLFDIPTDALGNVIVSYRGPAGSYRYISAADVLDGSADPALFEDAVILIGTTAEGLYDLRSTPVQRVYPGVEIHANIISGILDEGRFPVVTSWAEGLNIAVLLGVGILLAFWFPHLRPLFLVAFTLLAVPAYAGASLWLWQAQGIVTSLALPVLMLLTLGAVNAVFGFIRETRGRHRLKSMFGQYVPPQLVDEMNLNLGGSYGFDGESREMTVLFCDIRSFTSISERLAANELKQMLNYFFTPMTRLIFEQRGTIDKYVGDMIMAFWGAPLTDPDHRAHAIRTALAMLQQVRDMRPELEARDWPEINIGIGLNTGLMNVGDMGSEFRRSYTVIGDAVNLGSRLEGLTKFYGVGLIVSESTRAQQDGFVFRPLDRVRVKGKREAVAIFEPLCECDRAGAELRQELQAHEAALALYYGRQWDAAEQAFSALVERYPQRKVYGLFLARIPELCRQDLSADWDGAHTHTSK